MSSDAMTDEFDTVAAWTREAVQELGPDYALPAACRGSGSPAALAWLCEALQLDEGTSLLDVGAGVGGPGAFATRRYGVRAVLTDPMPTACIAARSLFELPVVVASGVRLPFADNAFDAAWALGVLCTVADKAALMGELRRLLVPSGQLGLLVLLRTVDNLPEQPEGNIFPSYDELQALLNKAGFLSIDEADAADFPPAPVAWEAHTDRVHALVQSQHGGEKAWLSAEQQSDCIGRLLSQGLLRTLLVHAVRAD